MATVTVGTQTVIGGGDPGCDGDGKSPTSRPSELHRQEGRGASPCARASGSAGVDPKVAKVGWLSSAADSVMAPSTDAYRTFSTDELFKAMNPATGQSESLPR
ncbi:hypothetical protein O1L55_06220 [Streptomyces albulus]|nr:hypothetical protein [Streptomyces noursei]